MFGVHTELFTAATSQWYDFIGSGGGMVAMRVQAASSVTTRYFQTDNLGSIAVITDESGNVVERDSYDAWGKRRFPTGADDPSGSLTSQTTRGYTGQEELADVGLVHLNGRVYDPLIGRMMSADPFVPDPMNGQAWNRYSYVINNPLALTDTNGYCFLGMCSWGKAISTFFGRTFGALFRAFPILGSLLEIAAVALFCQPAAVACMAAVGGLSSAFVTGVTSGSLGAALKAGLIAAVTQIANFEVGTFAKGLGDLSYLAGAAGHALVGCASAMVSGGKCGPAAAAAAVSSLASPFTNNLGRALGTVVSAVAGGLASVAGGGKFANGAVTGAFAYLTSPQSTAQDDEGLGDDEYGRAGKNDALKVRGISTCGNSLCGNIPVTCTDQGDCNLAIAQLDKFATVNDFRINFTLATTLSQALSPDVYTIKFMGDMGKVLGWAFQGGLELYGNGWQSENTVAHEFGHNLGLGHNGISDSLMYGYHSPPDAFQLLPNERAALINAYRR
jgi:RHS repeat-associated protein